MDFGSMMGGLAVGAGKSQLAGAAYDQTLAQTDDIRAQTQQRQMQALSMKQEMDDRSNGQADVKAGMETVAGGIKTQADIQKGATAAAGIAASKGHYGVAMEMEKLATSAEAQVKTQAMEHATEQLQKKEGAATAASGYLANPNPETAREVEQRAIAAGVDPRSIPQRSDPKFQSWAKQQEMAPMSAKERLDFLQKTDKAEQDRKEKAREFDEKAKDRRIEQARLATMREGNLEEKKYHDRMLEQARKDTIAQRGAAGGHKLTAQQINTIDGVVGATGEALRGLEIISKMPSAQTAGAFAGLHGDGVMSALSRVGGNALTPQSMQLYTVATQGLGMEIGRVLTLGGGRGVTQAQIDEFQSMVQARPGDTEVVAMFKYANAASILKNRLETLPDSPVEKVKGRQDAYIEKLSKIPDPADILALAAKNPRLAEQLSQAQVDMAGAVSKMAGAGGEPAPKLPAGWH